MSAAVRRSPLAHREPVEAADAVLRLRERPFEAKLIIRAHVGDAGKAFADAFGAEAPDNCRFVETDDGVAVAWLSPDEFLVIGVQDAEAGLEAKLADALGDSHHQTVNVTDYYTTLELAGPRAREALMKLTTLDMHARAFAHGDAKGTVFGHCNAWILQRRDDTEAGGPAFDLIVRWSHADYLYCALADAGREWDMPEVVPVSGEKLLP